MRFFSKEAKQSFPKNLRWFAGADSTILPKKLKAIIRTLLIVSGAIIIVLQLRFDGNN